MRSRKLNKAVFLDWRTNLPSLEKTNSRLFAPWFAFARLPAARWTNGAINLAKNFAGDQNLNPLVAKLFAEGAPTNLAGRRGGYDRVFARSGDQCRQRRKPRWNCGGLWKTRIPRPIRRARNFPGCFFLTTL